MNKTSLLITLLPLLFLTGCAGDQRTLAERARDSRLAILNPAIIRQGALASTAATSTDNDSSLPPDSTEKTKCKDHDRPGDKGCKREHDDDKHNDDKHDQGSH